jgi:hypothetical protein
MASYVETPTRSDTAAGAIAQFLRVKTPGAVAVAGASDVSIGTMEFPCLAAGPCTVRMRSAQGTRKMVAVDAITAGNAAYAAAAGKISATGSVYEGVAMETSANDGDVIEVMPAVQVDLVAAAGITLPTVTYNGATTVNKIIVPDNLADALSIVEAANKYITIVTTNGAEGVTFGKAVTLSSTLAVTGVATLAGNVANTAGVGITGTASSFVTSVEKIGTIIKTTILIDLAGLHAGGTAGDLIGANGSGVCHLGQITAAVNGTIFAGRMKCLETPATGDDDIDLYSATEATGVEDTAISALTATQLCNSGNLTNASDIALTAVPAANKYLYLVAQTGDAAADAYTAGILLIELWGKAA